MEGKLAVAAYEEVETITEMVARVMRLYRVERDLNEQSALSILPRLDENLPAAQSASNKHA